MASRTVGPAWRITSWSLPPGRAARTPSRPSTSATGDRLYDFLCSLLRDRDEAADVLHDSFIVAGARIHQLRDPAKLRLWLYAIARHEGLRRLRQKARQEPVEELEVTATGPEPDDVAAQDELRELVATAALGLNPRDRVVLDLHLRQGLDGQELGDAIGVSAGHAYVLLSRLRDQVERSLGALLVARMGRKDCVELAAILVDWDGRFSPIIRKRVARHVDGCETMQRAPPHAREPAEPPVRGPGHRRAGSGAPAGPRRRPAGQLHRGRRHGRGRRLPPPLFPRRRTRALAAAAATAAMIVLLLASVAVLGGIGGDTLDIELAGAPGGPAVAPATSPTSTTSTTVAAPGTSTTAAPPGSSTTGVPPNDLVHPTGPGEHHDHGDDPSRAGRPPATQAGRSDRPAGHHLDVERVGRRVRRGMPTTTTVVVSAGDPSGITSVNLSGQASGSSRMGPVGGDNYRSSVGPFAKGTVPRGGSGKVVMTVTATDGAGESGHRHQLLHAHRLSGVTPDDVSSSRRETVARRRSASSMAPSSNPARRHRAPSLGV